MPSQFQIATLLIYAASLGLYLLFLRGSSDQMGRVASVCLLGGIALHYLMLLERARASASVPYHDLAGSLSLFGWLLAVTYFGLELFHGKRSVGAFVVPCVLAASLAGWATPAAQASTLPARGTLFALHVTANILAYAAFGIACVTSSIYLWQERALRARRPGPAFWRFPAMELLEGMSRTSVWAGVAASAVGLTLGFLWAQRVEGHFFSGDPKEIVSLVVLAGYGVYLRVSRNAAWRGARASVLCIANFGLVVFSFTVVNLYLSRYHRYF